AAGKYYYQSPRQLARTRSERARRVADGAGERRPGADRAEGCHSRRAPAADYLSGDRVGGDGTERAGGCTRTGNERAPLRIGASFTTFYDGGSIIGVTPGH